MANTIQDRREQMIARLHAYVRRRVLPRLGASGEYSLTPATKGRRSIVVFLDCSAGRFVLKCHPELTRAARTYFAHRHVEKLSAPVPRLVHVDFSMRTYAELGALVLVEEAFPGKLLAEFEDRASAIAVAARALARFNDHTSEGYGALLPGVRRKVGYFEAVMRRVRRRMEQLVTSVRQFRGIDVAAMETWFNAFEKRVEDGSPYELTHLRMSGTNVLVGENGEARVIDIVTARYARSAFDLVNALHRWCHSPAQREILLDAYFAERRGMTRAQFDRDVAFYHACFHVSQAHDYGDRIEALQRARADGEPIERTKKRAALRVARQHLRAALDAMLESDVALPDGLKKAMRRAIARPRRKKNSARRAPAGSDGEPTDGESAASEAPE
jgi:Phosphotransferase enzyme family